MGAIQSPFAAWLIWLGVKTLPFRMACHCENAWHVAQFLESHLHVTRLAYPGLESFPQFELAQRQQSAGGAVMLPNDVYGLLPRGNRKRALQVFDQIVHVFYSDGYADKVCW
jgi:O-acetylhomoserine/O-acetylserine sulfhydrylase-like pyridoxal-dependent enzyme